jgi:hypothetical protein
MLARPSPPPNLGIFTLKRWCRHHSLLTHDITLRDHVQHIRLPSPSPSNNPAASKKLASAAQ